jgi:uncharacterized protein (DUF58 family)
MTAVVHLTARGGNRVGALVTNGERVTRLPALPGQDHARWEMRRVAATPRADTGTAGDDLATMLESLRRPQRRRGLVAVVSDFIGAAGTAPAWERPLRALSERHQLLAIEVLDPRELELAPAGLVTFADPETGQQLEVQTSDAGVRRRYADAAQAQREAIATALRRAGAAHLQLRTDRDWLTEIVKFVVARRRFVAGSMGSVVR